MRIVIVGGGIVGQSLAEHLLKDRHELSLVERDSALCEIIGEKLDLQIVCGSGSSPAVLRGAGLPDADMLLAVTPNNEVNIVACTIADQFDVTRRIARLRGREFSDSTALVDLQKLGITSVIHPEQVLVNHIMQYVESPHAVESANFEDGNILLRGYRIRDNMELAGKTPAQIRQQIDPYQVLFAAIIRNGVGMIPDGNMMIKGGDILYALLPRESLDRFLKMVGIERKPNRKIVITGDSYSTGELATALDATAHHVTLVDPSREHAEQMAAMLSKVEVLHGDCTQHDLLRELNIDKASFFISTSDGADYNMLSALLAKSEGAHEVVAVTTESRHNKLFHSIGIDHVINPRLTTAHGILEIIARGHIGAVVQLSDVDIEAVRLTVDEQSWVAGARVKKIARKLKTGSIIGVIVRDNSMILPDGETKIEPGDHVIVITHDKNLKAVTRLFAPGRSIF